MTAPAPSHGPIRRHSGPVPRPRRQRISARQHLLRAQRLESIAVLASGIAHNLNNVFTPIILSAELLRRKLPGPEAQQYLNALLGSASHGSEILQQMLTFAGGMEGDFTELHLPGLIGETGRALRAALPPNIVLETEIGPDLWPVCGNGAQLRQVLMNLGQNAGDAMAKGGRLVIRAQNTAIDTAMAKAHPGAQAGPHALVTLTDTGHGIPAEMLDRIFDPFFTTKDSGPGCGLGLSTAHGIVRSHGGFLLVHSEAGRGAEFQVFLPARQR